MKNRVTSRHDPRKQVGIARITLERLYIIREIRRGPGGHVVHDDNLPSRLEQGIDDMGSDETRSACDQSFHLG
jgi:hypothetical protein